MRKTIAVLMSIIIFALALTGCNRNTTLSNTRQQANWVVVNYFDIGTKVYEVKSWDQDSSGYTICLKNGNIIFVDPVNCVFSTEYPGGKEE